MSANTLPAQPVCPDVYKDRPALRVETAALTALYLPEDGGKLVSLKAKRDGFEFLCQNPAPAYARLAYDGSYIQSECASWDDMFPTIDPWTPDVGPFAGKTWLDHGEVCRLPMQTSVTKDGIRMHTSLRELPVDFEKVISPCADGALAVTYTLTNRSEHPFPYIWAAHCMLRGTDDLRVETPYPVDAPAAYMFGGEAAPSLPRDRLTGYAPGSGAAYKFYYTAPTDGGFVAGRYTASGHRFEMDYRADAAAVPYVGIWINNGGFKDLYNIALECCTAPYDAPDKAMDKGYCSVLGPREARTFTIRIRID